MQPVGDSGSHNYHGLSSHDIVDAISGIERPYYVFRAKRGQLAIVPVSLGDAREPLMIVIEIGAELIGHLHAGINKVVTIYPKTNIQKILERTNPKDILYQKKEHQFGLQLPSLNTLPFEGVPFYGPRLLFATLFRERP